MTTQAVRPSSDFIFYPPIEPYRQGFLPVSSMHTLYFEESGNPLGCPVLFLHGGPGGSSSPWVRSLFDPDFFRIILFDQRGCGRSTPHACIEENTTWDLVDDIEKLRIHLGISSWVVGGGSWGSTLAIAYAQRHPSRLKALFVRAIFLGEDYEFSWMFTEGGASRIFPEAWERFLDMVPKQDRAQPLSYYTKAILGTDQGLRKQAAIEFCRWEGALSRLTPDQESVNEPMDPAFALALASCEVHYFKNDLFFPEPQYLLRHMDRLKGIPGAIHHGRYDMVCPIESAIRLHRAWNEAEFQVVPLAGHTAKEEEGGRAFRMLMDRYKTLHNAKHKSIAERDNSIGGA